MTVHAPQSHARAFALAGLAACFSGCGAVPEIPSVLDQNALPSTVELTVPVGEAALIPDASAGGSAAKELLNESAAGPAQMQAEPTSADRASPLQQKATVETVPVPAETALAKRSLSAEGKALLDQLKLRVSDTNAFRIEKSRELIFEVNRPVPEPEGYAVLDQLATILSQCDRVVVHIIGHADNQFGTPGENQRLSVQRARWVARYLRRQGVPAKQIRTEGRGSTDLLVTDSTASDPVGRRRNRRVDVVLKPIVSDNKQSAWQSPAPHYR